MTEATTKRTNWKAMYELIKTKRLEDYQQYEEHTNGLKETITAQSNKITSLTQRNTDLCIQLREVENRSATQAVELINLKNEIDHLRMVIETLCKALNSKLEEE